MSKMIQDFPPRTINQGCKELSAGVRVATNWVDIRQLPYVELHIRVRRRIVQRSVQFLSTLIQLLGGYAEFSSPAVLLSRESWLNNRNPNFRIFHLTARRLNQCCCCTAAQSREYKYNGFLFGQYTLAQQYNEEVACSIHYRVVCAEPL